METLGSRQHGQGGRSETFLARQLRRIHTYDNWHVKGRFLLLAIDMDQRLNSGRAGAGASAHGTVSDASFCRGEAKRGLCAMPISVRVRPLSPACEAEAGWPRPALSHVPALTGPANVSRGRRRPSALFDIRRTGRQAGRMGEGEQAGVVWNMRARLGERRRGLSLSRWTGEGRGEGAVRTPLRA